MEILTAPVQMLNERAVECSTLLIDDPYVFSTASEGSSPLRPGAITLYFRRLRRPADLDHLQFRHLRRFVGTYGQQLGYSLAQVALRAGHNPAVAARHYTGVVAASDRRLTHAIDRLLHMEE